MDVLTAARAIVTPDELDHEGKLWTIKRIREVSGCGLLEGKIAYATVAVEVRTRQMKEAARKLVEAEDFAMYSMESGERHLRRLENMG